MKFSGESRLLRQFLLDIYDTLEQYSSEFANDKRRINWIAAHFVSNTNDVSPAQSWFLSLLMKNAHAHGVINPYANLKSLDYVLPALSSTDSFIKELILMFGDKTSSRTARDDLAKSKQGNSSVVEYNSRYTALALYVVQSDENAVIKYVAGLNPEVRYAAIHVAGWTDATTVAEKQVLAIQGQRIVDELVSMGGKPKKMMYQHPNANSPAPIPVQVVKPVISNPTQPHIPMEVDAINTQNDKRNPFPAIRSICIQNSLCFCCLQPYNVKTHMIGGERKCPNKNASLSDKLALISNTKDVTKRPFETKHQIAALAIGSDTAEQDDKALEDLEEEEKEAVGWLVEEYLAGLSEDHYPTTPEILNPVEINAIKLMADGSYPRRVVVPMTLRDASICVQLMAFFDIGLMNNFVDDRFARTHNLQLTKKKIPLKTEAYNG